MSIKTVITCDELKCENVLNLEGPYHIAKKEMKEAEWKTRKIDGKWYNFCKECAK